MNERRQPPYRPEHDPENKVQGNNESVPNVVPHIHNSSLGKRYCDHCGQPMIEHLLVNPPGTFRGDLKLPILRTRSNLENDRLSEGVFSSTIQTTTTGIVIGTPLTRTRDLEVGQLPKGTIRAHINIRSLAVLAQPIGAVGTPPTFTAFLYYQDIQSVLHILGAMSSSSLAVGSALGFAFDRTVVENPITDGAPPNIGAFAVEVISIALGTATRVDFVVRANISALFEVS